MPTKLDNLQTGFIDKNIIVTGGAGFVGSHLIEALAPYAKNVISVDNYLSGSVDNHIEGADYINASVSEINNILSGEGVDYIFHFGEYSRVEQSLDEPDVALSNISGTLPALLKFWNLRGAKLIYSGSSTKFADYGTGRNLSPYTLAKATNTEIIQSYGNWNNLRFAIIYFYNVYGGREIKDGKYSTLIAKYRSLVSEGAKKLPVSLPGGQLRNFTYIDDIVSGILHAALKGQGDEYGIGADEAFSIKEVCEMFGCEPNYYETNSANRKTGELKTEKIKKLGWNQSMKLPDYISLLSQVNK
jgi:UDP-glucose 4-epimerase